MVALALRLILAVALVTACAAPVARTPAPAPDEATADLWVIDHGWHTALVLRRADVPPGRWPALDDLPSAAFVEVAWGDREFYMARPASAWLAVKAALGSGGSVLHVAGLEAPPAVAFPASTVATLAISRAGLDALTRLVADEHQRDPEGRVIRLGPGLYGRSWFYAARGHYSLANTCNTWVARALQAGGLAVTPSSVMTAGDVMAQLAPLQKER